MSGSHGSLQPNLDGQVRLGLAGLGGRFGTLGPMAICNQTLMINVKMVSSRSIKIREEKFIKEDALLLSWINYSLFKVLDKTNVNLVESFFLTQVWKT